MRNRIVFAAHLTNYAEDGLPTEQHAAYYEARAAGGAGLIITEEHSTHPTDWPYEKLIHGFHREVIPGYRRITEAVHAPRRADLRPDQPQRRPGVVACTPACRCGRPSPVADPLFREVPKAVDEAEIAEIVAGYAARRRRTAPRAASTASSCSARTRRSCAASCRRPPTAAPTATAARLENRARLLLEIVAAVREAIGRDLALGVRLCGDELIEGGTTIDEAVEVAQARRGHRPRRLHQHLDRRGHGRRCS